MAVGAEDVFIAHALGLVLAVVAEAGQHRPKGLHALSQPGFAAVVFKAHHQAPAALGAAPELVVSDHALLGAHGVEIYRADEVAALAVVGLIVVPQHLVAAADGQEGDAVVDGGTDLPILAPVQILQQHLLLEVLPAADEHQVEVRKPRLGADGQPGDLSVDAPPAQAALQAQHVPPVAVEIQHVRVHMADFQFHGSLLTSPRILRRPPCAPPPAAAPAWRCRWASGRRAAPARRSSPPAWRSPAPRGSFDRRCRRT